MGNAASRAVERAATALLKYALAKSHMPIRHSIERPAEKNLTAMKRRGSRRGTQFTEIDVVRHRKSFDDSARQIDRQQSVGGSRWAQRCFQLDSGMNEGFFVWVEFVELLAYSRSSALRQQKVASVPVNPVEAGCAPQCQGDDSDERPVRFAVHCLLESALARASQGFSLNNS